MYLLFQSVNRKTNQPYLCNWDEQNNRRTENFNKNKPRATCLHSDFWWFCSLEAKVLFWQNSFFVTKLRRTPYAKPTKITTKEKFLETNYPWFWNHCSWFWMWLKSVKLIIYIRLAVSWKYPGILFKKQVHISPFFSIKRN